MNHFHLKTFLKRIKDKPWITAALKTSSLVKKILFKKWLKTKNTKDEFKYKDYRKYYKRISLEAENSYYSELFNSRTNSTKQLWRNLNHIIDVINYCRTQFNFALPSVLIEQRIVGNLWSTIACVIMYFVRPHFVNCVN